MSEPSRGFGYWLNIFANLAVVAGIIFLGVEVRQNSQMMMAQTRNEVASGVVDLLTFGLADAEFMNTVARGDAGEELTPLERRRYGQYRNAWLRYWENVHYQYRNGLYDEVEFGKQREAIATGAFSQPGLVSYWCQMRSGYSPEFVEEIDGLLTTHRCN